MDSEPEHLEHHQHDALSADEPVRGELKSAEAENLRLNDLSARKDSQPRDLDAHVDLHKDSEFDFEPIADDEDLLKDNGNHEANGEVRSESEGAEKDEAENKNEESEQTEEKEEQNDIEDKEDNEEEEESNQDDAAEQVPAHNVHEEEESKEESEEQESEDKAAEQEEEKSEESDEAEQNKSSFAEKREEESHKMEEEDVDHKQNVDAEENQSEDREDAPQKEEPMQIDEPEPEAQQVHQNESVPEEEVREEVPDKEQPEVKEESEEPQAPPAKKQRGRKAKKDKSAEPKLEKRQELSVPKEAKGGRKKSQESAQESVTSERGAYGKEHELKHLGKELHRSAHSVIYVSEGPIDAHYFGSCLVKHRLPRKYKGKEAENPSLNKVKNEVASLAKAKNMGVPVPAVYAVNLKHRLVCLEYFKNTVSLREYLEGKSDDYDDDTIIEMRKLFTALGNHIAEMHNGNVIHGGLSVESVLVDKAKLTLKLISFGLSSSSGNIEDKAGDLYAFIRSFPGNSDEYMRYNDLTHCVYTGYTARSLKLDSVVQRVQKIKQKLKSQAQ